MKLKNVKELCELIWELEKKFNLLDFEIDGVKPWQFRRVPLYFIFSQRTGIHAMTNPRLSVFNKVMSLYMFVKNSFLNNPFLAKKSDVMIFSHERSKLVNDEHIDIYTHFLKEDLNDQNISYTEMERPFLAKHIRTKDPKKKYLDFAIKKCLFSAVTCMRFIQTSIKLFFKCLLFKKPK